MGVDEHLRRAGRDLVDRSGTGQTPDGVRRLHRRRRATKAALPAVAALVVGVMVWSGGSEESSVDTIDTATSSTTVVDEGPVQIEAGRGPTTVLAADGTVLATIADGDLVPGRDDLALAVSNELMGVGTGAGSPASVALTEAGLLDRPDDAWEQLADAGLVITTTIDMEAQEAARRAIDGVGLPPTLAAALWSIEPMSGATLAVAGPAATVRREGAGAIRPAMMAVALESGVGADERLENPPRLDVPVEGTIWRVEVAGAEGTEPITLGEALARGANIPWVGLINDGRIDETFYSDVAERFGFQDLEPTVPAMVLGAFSTDPAEVARMTAVFAGDGSRPDVHMVRSVRTQDDRLVFERDAAPARRAPVVEASTLEAVRAAMTEAVCCGTAVGAQFGGDVGQIGVTGTGQTATAWFSGSTPALTTAVWVGSMEPMIGTIDENPLTGGGAPASIWAQYTRSVTDDEPKTFPR